MDISSSASFSKSSSRTGHQRKSRLNAGNSKNIFGDSKLSTSSSRIKGSTAGSNNETTTVRIVIDGKDLTPLPLSNSIEETPEEDNNAPSTTTNPNNISSVENKTEQWPNNDTALSDSTKERPEISSKLTEEDLEKEVEMFLNETTTETVFHIRGVCVGVDYSYHKHITQRNELYDKNCEARLTADIYNGSITQTPNGDMKHKEISATAAPTQDSSCQASSWDIYDHNKIVNEQSLMAEGTDMAELFGESRTKDEKLNHSKSSNEAGERIENEGQEKQIANTSLQHILSLRVQQVDSTVQENVSKPGCLLCVEKETKQMKKEKCESPDSMSKVDESATLEEILESEGLKESLRTVERGIQQNIYHEKHLFYRGIPIADVNYENELKNEQGETTSFENSSDNTSTSPSNVTNGDKEDAEESNIETLSQENPENNNDQSENEESMLKEQVTSPDTNAAEEINNNLEKEEKLLQNTNLEATELSASVNEEQKVVKPSLQLLWKFNCEQSEGRNVSGMTWNKANKDLLAVSYCQFEFNEQSDGLILFWTLKNPEYPERIIKTTSGVSSVDFSTINPSLLGVGMYDGTVAVYDLFQKHNKPVVDSSQLSAQHKDAVWQVKWVNKREKGEVLVSMSTDGRVTEWSLKKGLSSTDLMILKRVNVPPQLGGGGEGIISRTAAGLCFDFPVDDPNIYYAGTEDGTIHKCSCSYNEQYLETYFGHTGPVYKVRCSPFCTDVVLSCSADWSAKLWDPKQEQPILSFQSVDLTSVVHDIRWSPTHSTVFGLIAGDGRVEIWDLSRNTLDPVITEFAYSKPETEIEKDVDREKTDEEKESASSENTKNQTTFSTIAFSENAPIVVVGTSTGQVNVFRIRGLKGLNNTDVNTIDQEREALREVLKLETSKTS